MWRILPLVLLGSLLGCGESRDCTFAACGGSTPELPFVDESGAPVTASGELRTTQLPEPREFICWGQQAPRGEPCGNGVLGFTHVGGHGIDRNDLVEVRFRLSDGTLTEWQPAAYDVERHTDPDFNGPGCPCSWDEITLEPMIVPAAAQLSPQGEYLFPPQ